MHDEDGWRIVSTDGGWRIVSIRTSQTTALYDGMHRLICKLSWKYCRGSSLSVHDFISEGYLALLQVGDKYDPERGAKSTFVYWVVRNHFLDLRARYPLSLELPTNITDHDPVVALENAHTFRSLVSSLSSEAKEVVKIICQSPKELMDIAKTGTPERLQNAVVKLLRRRQVNGWTKAHINKLLGEIKITIQKL